jgi:hypothetical protein
MPKGGMAGRPKGHLELPEAQRQELERIARAGTSEKRMVFRARLILECATGADNVPVVHASSWKLRSFNQFEREIVKGRT